MNIKFQRWLLIALLCFSYVSRVPGLLRQGWIGFPALVVGLVITVVLISLVFRSSAKGALVVTILAAIGFVMTLLSQLVAGPYFFGVARAPIISIIYLATFPAITAICGFNLWRAWSKKPIIEE
jgi:hypothetical protein